MTKTNNKIAELNDHFRRCLGRPEDAPVPGRRVQTGGLAALAPFTQIEISFAVRDFVFPQFDRENDPHGDRDFGVIKLSGVELVVWKIDYYADDSMTQGSADPSDPARCYRLLTIMLASEY